MSNQFMPIITEHLLVPVVTALAAALVGLIGYIGTAAKRKFDAEATKAQAGTHALDVAALVNAMQRKAVADVGTSATPAPTPADIVAYLERIRPDLLAKMQVQPEALETMAQAAIVSAEVAMAAPVVVAPAAPLSTGV